MFSCSYFLLIIIPRIDVIGHGNGHQAKEGSKQERDDDDDDEWNDEAW